MSGCVFAVLLGVLSGLVCTTASFADGSPIAGVRATVRVDGQLSIAL